jgi:hypothetical protein
MRRFLTAHAAIWTSRAGPAYRSAVRKRLERGGQWEYVGRAGAPPVRLAAGALGGALRGRWAAQRFVRRWYAGTISRILRWAPAA